MTSLTGAQFEVYSYSQEVEQNVYRWMNEPAPRTTSAAKTRAKLIKETRESNAQHPEIGTWLH